MMFNSTKTQCIIDLAKYQFWPNDLYLTVLQRAQKGFYPCIVSRGKKCGLLLKRKKVLFGLIIQQLNLLRIIRTSEGLYDLVSPRRLINKCNTGATASRFLFSDKHAPKIPVAPKTTKRNIVKC